VQNPNRFRSLTGFPFSFGENLFRQIKSRSCVRATTSISKKSNQEVMKQLFIYAGMLGLIGGAALNAQQVTFSYTGAVQTYTVPACVYSLDVDVRGAQGGQATDAGASIGGQGGRVIATIPVTPGEILNIYVGQKPTTTTGGWNGGGTTSLFAGAGGGASDIRRSGTALTNRIVVAGGGGGAGHFGSSTQYVGGDGGNLIAGDGFLGQGAGIGGKQSCGGAGGTGSAGNGGPGVLGIGGSSSADGGAGGGGYYGGGAGGSTQVLHCSGGGGSSYVCPGASGIVHTLGYQFGNGQIIISPVMGTASPGPVFGPNVVCPWSTETFSVPGAQNVTTYNWSFPAGTTINSGQGTTMVNVTFGAMSGSVTVTANGPCGLSSPSEYEVNTAPNLLIAGLAAEYCVDDAPVTVTPMPAGGILSGPGISGNTFDPSAAGTGTHTITYARAEENYSYSSSGEFSPVTGSPTNVTLGNNQVSSALPIGFTFNFYGINYSSFYISSNGFITFNAGSGDGCCMGSVLPNNDPSVSNLIAFCWNDLNPAAGGTISYFTTGTSPNRKLAVNFSNVPYATGGSPMTAQLVLSESSNIVEIYTTVSMGNGNNQTMGIENNGGTIATTVLSRNSGNWIAVNDYVRFMPPPTCSAIATITVNPLPAVPVITANGNSICPGDSLLLTSSPAMNYYWNPSGNSQSMYATNPGNYSVTVSDANGCSAASAPFTVFQWAAPSPAITVNGPTTFCQGSSVLLTSSSASSYWWSTGQSANSISVNSSGNYYVTVTDSNGCAGTSSPLTVTVNQNPVVAISNLSGGYCLSNPPVNLVGSPSGGTFAGPGVTGNSFSPANAGAGQHAITYTYTDANGCTGSASGNTNVSSNAYVDLGADTIICSTATLTLNAGNFSAYTWQDNSTASNFIVNGNNLGPGNYTFYVNVTDANGCNGADTIHVNVSICTGIAAAAGFSFGVLPNPSEGIFTLQLNNSFADEISVEVFNLQGQHVMTRHIEINSSDRAEIDLTVLGKGIYYLRVSDGENSAVEKIIIL
jgi:hypothetical protein